MQSDSQPRASYRESGEADWPVFIFWSFVTLLVSLVLAIFMHVLFVHGMYLLVMVPLIASLGVGFLAGYAADAGKCRNYKLVVALTILASIILYFGYWYISMLATLGGNFYYRIDLLPRYIQWRMASDVIREVGHSAHPVRTQTGVDVGFKWFFFAMEVVFVPFSALGIASIRASRAFCENCQTWMEKHRTTFAAGTGPALVEALQTGRLSAVREIPSVVTVAKTKYTILQVETCCCEEKPKATCSHYLSVTEQSTDQNGTLPHTLGVLRKPLLSRVEVNTNELAQVAVKFPKLKFLVAKITEPEHFACAIRELSSAVPTQSDKVEEFPVTEPYAGAVLTRQTRWTAGTLELLPLLLCIGGLFGGLGAGVLLESKTPVSMLRLIVAISGISIGAFFFLYGGYYGLWKGSPWLHPYLLKTFRTVLSQRRDALFDPNDPSVQLVELSPRERWGQLTLTNKNEVGLVKVDLLNQVILFEGDKQRIRIPAAAVRGCRIEEYISGAGTHGAKRVIMAVLLANAKDGEWEAPFEPKIATGKSTKEQTRLAQQLCNQIEKLRCG